MPVGFRIRRSSIPSAGHRKRASRVPSFRYFPFGGGARVCIGERFAWMEGVIVMAAIAQKWRFRLEPGQHVEPLPLITLRVKNGLRMIAEPRATVKSLRRAGT